MTVDAADVLVHQEVIGRGKRHAPGVVSSVLEHFQRGENRRTDIALLADVAENAAHAVPSLAGTPA
jgi:hypothetical protein